MTALAPARCGVEPSAASTVATASGCPASISSMILR
jgi:hypothetical protein